MRTILGRLTGDATQQNVAERIATLPMRSGGLGLRSADRTAPAAYWASWADAMPMFSRRLRELTTHIIEEMARGPQGCLAELSTACARLDRSGFISRRDHPLHAAPSLASGSMAGNITRLPLSSITFGRPWCWPSHVPQTRLICDHTQALELARFFWELPRDQSSGLNPNCSAHSHVEKFIRTRGSQEVTT